MKVQARGATSGARARAPTLAPRWSIDTGDYVASACVLEGTPLVLAGTGAGEVVAVERAAGAVAWRRQTHALGVLSVAADPSRAHAIAVAGAGPAVHLLGPDGSARAAFESRAPMVDQLSWSPAGRYLAVGAGARIQLWEPGGTLALETVPQRSSVTAIQWRVTGAQFATCGYGGVQLWDTERGIGMSRLQWQGSLVSMAWSPDGRVIACGSQDCTVHFWRVHNGEDSEIRGFASKPKALAWDAKSEWLATAGGPTISLWRFSGRGPEGTRPRVLEGHLGNVAIAAFHPSRTWLATGGSDGGVLLWLPKRTDSPVGAIFMDDPVTALCWTRDGAALLVADAGGRMALLDVDTRELTRLSKAGSGLLDTFDDRLQRGAFDD